MRRLLLLTHLGLAFVFVQLWQGVDAFGIRERNGQQLPTIPRTVLSKSSSLFSTPSPTGTESTMSALELNRRIKYSMMGADLSQRWFELVQDEKVAVATTFQDETGQNVDVRYGVRVHPTAVDSKPVSFMEFVESLDGLIAHPRIANMNETLKQAAQISDTPNTNVNSEGSLQFRSDGDYIAQLQLVRTLRPPPSPGFGQSASDFRTTSVPPLYDASTDSFVTGPLRLQLRPLVARIQNYVLSTNWDVFHNISPADVRGHFLLIPTIEDEERNWRGQALVESDCHDLVHLASEIQPTGNLMVCFNSVGAGASQNHIHCHLWPSPPIPFLQQIETLDGWNSYAASRASPVETIQLSNNDSSSDVTAQVSLLDYPCSCIKVSSRQIGGSDNLSGYDAAGNTLWTILQSIGESPHNVCIINRPGINESDNIDIYVFVRSRERSPNVISATKAGASEMMGVFHCQSLEQLEELESPAGDEDERSINENEKIRPMVQLLQDVSHDDPVELWKRIKKKLQR